MSETLELFAACVPGLEAVVADELRELGYADAKPVAGGVELTGNLRAVARINLWSRCAGRLLVRVARFRCQHLSKLREAAARVDWSPFVADITQPLRVRATCHKSRIYHSGAAAERIRDGLADALGSTPPPGDEGDAATLHARIERDEVTLSIDSSGAHLHQRGYRQRTAKAPLRETVAAAFLRVAGWTGESALLDPMCGAGTFAIEAAMVAAGLPPGGERRFACQGWPAMPADAFEWSAQPVGEPVIVASDRDAGAVEATAENAVRAGVGDLVQVEKRPLSAIEPPAERGLLITNPPWGQRVKGGRDVRNLYARLGQLAQGSFARWALAFVTSKSALARATGLTLTEPLPPIDHGGTQVRLCLRSAR